MPKPLDLKVVKSRLSSIKGFELDEKDNRLVRDVTLPSFKAAIKFINNIADIAEKLDHHPEIYNVYNKVSLALSTHSAGGITDADFELAKRINALPSH